MANTFELIASSTVGSGGAASIDFTSISSTYTDLVVKLSLRNTEDTIIAYVRFNSSTTNLSFRNLYGAPTSVGSINGASNVTIYGGANASGYTANTFSNVDIYVPNYAGSTNKSLSIDGVSETDATENYLSITAGLWSDSAAITSVNIIPGSAGNFVEYSTAYLYGVKNA